LSKKYLAIIFLLSIFSLFGCEDSYQTSLGITMVPNKWDPDPDITDKKFVLTASCFELSWKETYRLARKFSVEITAGDSDELPYAGDHKPANHLFGVYNPGGFRAYVNENQTALGFEIGHYLAQMTIDLTALYDESPDGPAHRCGSFADRPFNEKLLDLDRDH